MKCDFGTISERDMDMLFLNAFGVDKGILKLFIGKTDLPKDDCLISEFAKKPNQQFRRLMSYMK